MNNKKLMIIDGSSLVHRAFYAPEFCSKLIDS